MRTSGVLLLAGLVLAWTAGVRAEGPAPAAKTAPGTGQVVVADSAQPAPAKGDPSPAGGGDYIRTKAGVEFRGKISEESGDKVTIVTASGSVTIPRDQIDVLQKAGVDMRPPSERIAATAIPAGQAREYVEKAGAHAKKGEHEAVVGICKGLLALKPDELTEEQLPVVTQMAAQAYFYLTDWKAAADSLRSASRLMKEPVDQQRLAATAEALAENVPPSIAGQTAESFLQAQQLAMRWKADRLFEEAKSALDSVKEGNRQDVLGQALKVAESRLAKSEVFVPGYAGPRFSEICKSLVTRLVEEAGQAAADCAVQRDWLTRNYMLKFSSPALAAMWNEKCVAYMNLRQGGAERVDNVDYVEEKYPLKSAYKDDEFKGLKERCKKLGEELEKLRYYENDAGPDNRYKTKGKVILPSRIGSN